MRGCALFKNLSRCTYHVAGFPESTLKYLEGKGHVIGNAALKAEVQGIVKDDKGLVTAHSDSRKSGRAIIVEETQQTQDDN